MVLSTLQTIALIVGIAYYLIIMRNSQRNQQMQLETRQAQLFMQLADTYVEQGYRSTALEMLSDKWSWEDFDDFLKKYGPEANPEAWNKFQLQLSHWSLQGFLVRDGLLSAEDIFSWWGWVPRSMWEKFEPIIVEYRIRFESPPKGMLHGSFEDLYYAMLEVQDRFRENFLEKELPARIKKRKELGLKPIPSYT
jgi:hypothetical protein